MGFITATLMALGLGQQASSAKDAGKARRSAGVQAREEQARQETAAATLEQEAKDKAKETVTSKRKTLLRSATVKTSSQGAKLGLGDVSRKSLIGN